MGDQADYPRRQRIWLQVPQRSHAERVVDEPHATGPAQRHTRVGRRRRDLLAQAVRGPEQHRRRCTDLRGELQLLDKRRVGHPEQDHVDGSVEIGQRRDARKASDTVVARIDQMHTGRAPLRLEHHSSTEAVGSVTGADHRHRAGAEHRGHGRPPRLAHRLRRRRFLSESAARAACQPGIPHTPPPAWVAELPLYSPEMGVR